MLDLHEDRLREALADDENNLCAFDPMKVDADALGSFIEAAVAQGVIGREDSGVSISIYPLSLGEPEPLVAVQTSRPIVVGGAVIFETGLNDEEGRSTPCAGSWKQATPSRQPAQTITTS